MKKEYIAPAMEKIEVASANIIATSINIGEDMENGVTGANQHRGEWGNLWK